MTAMPRPETALRGVIPYINLEGASNASAFYQRAFAAKELHRLPTPDGGKLMHCCLEINGGALMISDCFPEHGVVAQPSGSYTMHLQVDDVDRWWSRAVDAGATVTMPLQKMFWGDRYGQLRDPFGVTWSLGAPDKG